MHPFWIVTDKSDEHQSLGGDAMVYAFRYGCKKCFVNAMAPFMDEARERYRGALLEITKMGRVCEDFLDCKHPACSDSCGAVLVALEALKGNDPNDANSQPPQSP